MLPIPKAWSIFMYEDAVNMSYSFDGLVRIIKKKHGEIGPNQLFCFVNRDLSRTKFIYKDKGGLAIWYKRLDKGTFNVSHDGKSGLRQITSIDLKKLLTDFNQIKIAA